MKSFLDKLKATKLYVFITSKSFRTFSFILVIGLTIFLLINNYGDKEINAATEADTFTVEIININENAGLATIAYKEGENYIDTGKTKLEVKSGTKIKFYYKDGLNEGYNILFWANYESNVFAPVKDPGDNESYYVSTSFVKTIKSDLTLVVVSIKETEKIVYFYNSSVKEHRSMIGVDVVDFGKDATFKFNTPKNRGFDFIGWSEDLTTITSNMEIYPLYKSSVWTVFRDYYPMFFRGLAVTLLLSVISVFCALFLGIILCLMRLSKSYILKFVAAAYVEVIRGVPLLLQLLVIYIILGPSKIHIGSFFTTEVISCLLALFINSGAYSSEIFRSGIQAVDKGQMEAGRALGLSNWQVMIKVVIPQGIKNSLPSIGNELVSIIKETSLAVSVDASIGELMSVRKQITAATYINLPPYIVIAIIYFCVTFSLSKLIGHLEKRLQTHEH